MKNYEHKAGVTLVEMLIVVAVIALLASMVIGIAGRIDNQDREQLAESTIAILTAALEQFQDYGYQYKHPDYSDFDFPLDCNDFPQIALQTTLEGALGLGAGSVSIVGIDRDGAEHSVDEEREYSGCEALCFFLNRVPESRKTLEEIDESLITSKGTSGAIKVSRTIIVDNKYYPLLRIIDPWGKTLRYDYYYCLPLTITPDYDSRRNFPVISSAGPDGFFGTVDDISSR